MSAGVGDPLHLWSRTQLDVARAAPRQMALPLAVVASDLPGFDNADRAYLRRVAMALAHGNDDDALTIVREAIDARAGCGAHRARPEAVVLEAVLWLLAQPPAGQAAR